VVVPTEIVVAVVTVIVGVAVWPNGQQVGIFQLKPGGHEWRAGKSPPCPRAPPFMVQLVLAINE
jgi:hypothetical protein